MSKALEFFPKDAKKGFDSDRYGIEVNAPVSGKGNIPGEVGLELELEASNNLPPRVDTNVKGVGWVAHADGSLRHGGLEYTLSAPCPREDVEPLLYGLFDEIKAYKTKLKLSTRCSTHVHVNVSTMTLNQMCSFVALWATFENVLVPWCGPERLGNLFCLRLCDAEYSIEQWVQAFKTGNFIFSNEYKYMALNPAAFNRFGSLEIRTLRGADNPELVIKWVNCLLRLRDVAVQRYEDPTTLVQDVSVQGGVGFLRQVLEGLPILDEIEEVCKKIDLDIDKEVLAGFRRIQPVIFSVPWNVLLPEIKKPFVPDPFGGKRKKAPKTPVLNGARIQFTNVAIPEPQPIAQRDEPIVRADHERRGWITVNGVPYNMNNHTHRQLIRDYGLRADASLDRHSWRIINTRGLAVTVVARDRLAEDIGEDDF